MKYSGVYVWNLIGTEKYYVGQSIDVCARTMQHLASIEDPACNTKWARALKENGPLAFEIIRGVPCPSDKNKLDELEVKLIQEYNAYYDGFNSTRGNHWDKTIVKDAVVTSREQRMLPVTKSNAKIIFNNVKSYKNKRVLVIGTFDSIIIKTLILNGCNVTVVENVDNNDDYWLTEEDAHYFVDTVKEAILNKVKELTMNRDFDLVIANPPYGEASKIIDEAMKHCSTGIVLMPFSKLNAYGLYKKVLECTEADAELFEDAQISKNTLCVLKLLKNYNNEYEDWSSFKAAYKTESCYREFYILNQRLPKTVDGRSNMNVDIDVSSCFMISARVGDDGVHKSADCMDYRFNVLENLPVEEWSVNTYKGHSQWNFTPYRLSSAKAKKNLCRFWYDNPLMNDLIRKSGESGSSYNVAMPRINWELNLDWENVTYEELLQIVKHDLRELGLSDEVN